MMSKVSDWIAGIVTLQTRKARGLKLGCGYAVYSTRKRYITDPKSKGTET